MIDDRLIRFIREELGLSFLAGKLETWKKSGEDSDELPLIILQECYYFSAKEITRYRQLLAAYRKMSPAEFTKETGDYFFSLRQYGAAVACYERILEDWRLKSISDEFTAAVWNNIGASYAGIFWFDKAMTAYEMSYNFKKDPNTLKRICQLTLLRPELKVRERYQLLIREEQREAWQRELQEKQEEMAASKRLKDLEAVFDQEPEKRMREAGALVTRWKKEYRKML